MVDLQRMTAALWRSAEDKMRSDFGNPMVAGRFIPPDKMDEYERARHEDIEAELRVMLDDLYECVQRNLEEFKDGKLPPCLRSKNDRD